MRIESVVGIHSEAEPTCRHHWDIEPPGSQISLGICRDCGSKREFYNYSGDWGLYGDPFKEAGSLAPFGIPQKGVDEDNIIDD